MDPTNEPLEPTIEQAPERRTSSEELPEDDREESGLTHPESSVQKAPPPGPRP
jgi:hypothetical protein